MDFDGGLKYHGPVEIADVKKKVKKLSSKAWGLDQGDRKKLAGDRPGNALFVMTDTPHNYSDRTMEGMEAGKIHVFRGGGWNLLHKLSMALIKDYVLPIYSNCLPMRVQYAQLPPGKDINHHYDVGILTEIHRLHVPIITNKGVEFHVERDKFYLEEGCLYELNNVKSHGVRNLSNHMRTHMMIDMVPLDKADIEYHDSPDDMSNGKTFEAYFNV